MKNTDTGISRQTINYHEYILNLQEKIDTILKKWRI